MVTVTSDYVFLSGLLQTGGSLYTSNVMLSPFQHAWLGLPSAVR